MKKQTGPSMTRKLRKLVPALLPALLLSACEEPTATTPPAPAKRVVRLSPIATKWIELDDASRYGMGENLYQKLAARLEQSGKFVVMLKDLEKSSSKSLKVSAAVAPPADASDRLRFDFAALPAAEFSAEIDELSFAHGSRGLHRFAGFAGQFRNRYNDGAFTNKNEFPARTLDIVTGWFGTSFDAIGQDPYSTLTGIDFGAEGEFNAVVAGVNYRRDVYDATAKVRTETLLLAENENRPAVLDASGTGFLFAFGATYQSISAEFGLVRRTALKDTFDRSLDGLAAEIEKQLFAIPFRTRIERNGSEGVILNAGRREGIRVGDVFLHKAAGKVSRLTVKEVFAIGSLVTSDTTDLRIGDVVTLEEASAAAPAAPAAAKTAKAGAKLSAASVKAAEAPSTEPTLPDNRDAPVNTPVPAKLSKIIIEAPEIHDPDGNLTKGFSAKGLLAPIYALRYFQYDQAIDASLKPGNLGDVSAAARARWNLSSVGVPDAFAQGLSGKGVTVAVIDSGVDYNHRNLAGAISRTKVGFDFMSYDERPFDDNSHGTAVAGIVAAQNAEKSQVGVAPGAKILAYKVFDPYGQTTSAALYGAFERAIADGAKIILCAWDTRKESEALREAIALAEQSGVLVITAAGDKGVDIREIPHFPARYNDRGNVITVTALDQAGKLGTVTGRYSNYGAGAVDIAAPGIGLEVLSPRSNYLDRSGSDLAAAHVAGAAALAWERNPALNAAGVKDLLLNAARRDPALLEQVSEGRALNVSAAVR